MAHSLPNCIERVQLLVQRKGLPHVGPRRPEMRPTWIERDLVFWDSEGCDVYSSITRNSSLSLQASAVTERGTLSEMSGPSTDELSQVKYCGSVFSGLVSV